MLRDVCMMYRRSEDVSVQSVLYTTIYCTLEVNLQKIKLVIAYNDMNILLMRPRWCCASEMLVTVLRNPMYKYIYWLNESGNEIILGLSKV